MGLVYDVFQRPALVEPDAVLEEEIGPPLIQVWPGRRYVRGDQHAARIPQGMIGRKRPILEYIKAGSRDLALLQCIR